VQLDENGSDCRQLDSGESRRHKRTFRCEEDAKSEKEILTTEIGAPVGDNQNSQTAGAGGPVLLEDAHLIEKLARFDRERIPECVVHATGSGVYGHFEVTKDVTK
jgi:catalase